MHNAISIPAAKTLSLGGRLPAIAVLAFGVVVLYCVGFSAPSVAHNATHDTRHANGFPCH
ncbi:MAG: CbtB-domain containing protein [Bryobacterales bacterium]|nr:CbtB-domain containing protein [Bryobacterales bacterium]